MLAGEDRLVAVLDRSRARGFLGPGDVHAHIAHAGAFLAAWSEPPRRLVDLGSGGGVPGLILAVAWDDTEFVLLDAQARRTAFLTEAVAALGIGARVEIVTGRAEDVARDPRHRARSDAVTARSFGPPSVTAECAVGFLCAGGQLTVAEPPGAPDARWPVDGLAALGLVDLGVVSTSGASVRRLRLPEPVVARWPRRTGVPERRPLF